MLSSPVIVVLGPSGLETARRVQRHLEAGEIHGLRGRVTGADVSFDAAAAHLQTLFEGGQPIIGLCSAGILIRALAPVLSDKRAEPPVLAVAETGRSVVPLLGGHRGANDLACRIAEGLGAAPALTTAGDARFGVALDDPPKGWVLANPQDAKGVMAALLDGVSARLTGTADWLAGARLPLAMDGTIELKATEKAEPGGPERLVYHPKTLVMGVGCERGCDPRELIALAEQVLASADLAAASLALIVSLDLKADEGAVHALADHFGVPARFYSAERLSEEAPRLANPSEQVRREVGCPGVAEGAALAAGGVDATLIVEKTKSARATCAIARAPMLVDAASLGRARGRLSVVGIGPGGKDWRSPEATRLLGEASEWVGYGPYLDLVADLARGKRQHRFQLGAENERARHALELAGEGRDVALVCSGDAGIYAMASLVVELLDGARGGVPVSTAARRAELIVVPGISAFQAAAARVGAPLGHDFCAVSLSDLLTPWEVIEQRLKAAAEGDFVVALYNPRSQRRRDQIIAAMDILRALRPADTPVIIASNLGRPQEAVATTTLAAFDPDRVDMLTVVIVGSSATRLVEAQGERSHVYTPRGYERKRKAS